MAIDQGTLGFSQVVTTPSTPPVNVAIIYFKTDNVLYILDSGGIETPIGTAAGITQLTGDVTATGPGIVPASVISVGGKTASQIASAVTAYLAATSANTPSTIVQRDGSGNFSATTITANLTGSASNNVLKSGDTMTGALNINNGSSTALIVDTNVLVVDGATNRVGINKVNPTEALEVVGNVVISGTLTASNISGINTGDITISDTADIDLTLLGQLLSGVLTPTGVAAATYGSGSSIPTIIVDNKGRITSASNNTLIAGNVSGFDEAAQDAVGNILTDTASIDFTYNDAGNIITADVLPAGVDHNSLMNFVANKHIDHSSVSISAGSGLTGGGDITTSRTISMPAVGTPGTYGTASSIPSITTDTQGRISAVTVNSISIPSTQVTDFTEASQDAVGSILIDTATIDFTYDDAGNQITADVKDNSISNIKLTTGINANKISSGIVSNTEFDYLDGVTSSIQSQLNSISGSAVTSLTGDVTGTGPGATASTVVSVGTSSAANIHTAELAANAATSTNAVSTIVKRDSSGNFSAGTITANLTGNVSGSSASFTGALAGDVTGTQSATTISNTTITAKLLTGYVVGANTALTSTDSILVAFEKVQGQINATTGAAITGLTGDVTATGPGNVTGTVNSVGTSSAANIHTAELAANAATALNTVSTIVKRDINGDFAAGLINSVSIQAHASRHLPSGADPLTTAAPIANLSSTTTNSVGAVNSLARSDHSHAISTGVVSTQTPDQANAAGTSVNLAKADHIHNIPSATPVQIGTTNFQGAAASFALSDHVHSHGNQTNGTLHAAVTTSINGFMSAIDKTKLDASTASNTPSTIVMRDGSGNFSASTITANLTGNVSGSSASFTGALVGDVTGTQGATVVSTVGTSSAANVHTAELAANAATSANTVSTIVKRDASGNFSAGVITASLTGNVTGNVSGSAASFTGSLVGDVTGTQGATVVSTVGTSSAANIHSAELAANAATSANTPSTIVQRDASGNFSAGTITASLTGNVTGNVSGTSANVTGIVAIVNGGTNASTVNQARQNLIIDNRTTFNNVNYTILSTDRCVVQIGTLTAIRTITLPLANSVNPGYEIIIEDESGSVNLTNFITINKSGSDTINGTTSENLQAPYGFRRLFSNGTNSWTFDGGILRSSKNLSDLQSTSTARTNLGLTNSATITATSANTPSTIVLRDASGNFSAGTITAALTGNATNVTGVVAIANGGTNSAVALNNNRVMQSSGGAIIEAAAITAARALISDANGIPTQSVTTSAELAFVSGVTSAIQTQINGKQATGNYITATTGDVVATGPGSVTATIQSNVVSNSKLAQMAANTIKGNNTGGTANALDLTVAQVNSMLGTVTSVTASSPLASSGGATPNITISNQSANTILAGPTSGAAAAPTFRALVAADIPLHTNVTKTGNYTILSTDDIIFADSSGGAFNLTLPSPAALAGKVFRVIDTTGNFQTNNVTLVRNGSEKISGLAASKALQTNWGWFNITSNGTDWYIGG